VDVVEAVFDALSGFEALVVDAVSEEVDSFAPDDSFVDSFATAVDDVPLVRLSVA